MQQALNIHAKFPYMNEHPITGAFTGLTHKTRDVDLHLFLALHNFILNESVHKEYRLMYSSRSLCCSRDLWDATYCHQEQSKSMYIFQFLCILW